LADRAVFRVYRRKSSDILDALIGKEIIGMNGVHDLGGLHGFGPIEYEPDEPVFHESWEGRVFGMSLSLAGDDGPNLDAARHRSERLDPVAYFQNGYYGRWLAAVEMMLHEEGLLGVNELETRLAGAAAQSDSKPLPPPRTDPPLRGLDFIREIDALPKYHNGQPVRTRNHQPAGHCRLPAYARCRPGTVVRVHEAMVFADTNAHHQGENPEYVYTIEFDGEELWGEVAETRTVVNLDLFESYLEER
jgi:nitrile hydratase beta subunit